MAVNLKTTLTFDACMYVCVCVCMYVYVESTQTQNQKYVIKTIKDLELDYFLQILGDYYYHMMVGSRRSSFVAVMSCVGSHETLPLPCDVVQ